MGPLALGNARRAIEALAPAERFFRRHGLAPVCSLAEWVRVEALFLEGLGGEGREAPRDIELDPAGARSDLAAVLRPLLAARIILEKGTEATDLARAADLLAGAGAALAGNPLPEWEVRLEALREILRARGGRHSPRRTGEGRRSREG